MLIEENTFSNKPNSASFWSFCWTSPQGSVVHADLLLSPSGAAVPLLQGKLCQAVAAQLVILCEHLPSCFCSLWVWLLATDRWGGRAGSGAEWLPNLAQLPSGVQPLPGWPESLYTPWQAPRPASCSRFTLVQTHSGRAAGPQPRGQQWVDRRLFCTRLDVEAWDRNNKFSSNAPFCKCWHARTQSSSAGGNSAAAAA